MELENQSVLVTGSSRGIGAAVATLAKDRGARVILHGRTESEPLKELSKSFSSPYLCFDVGDQQATHKAIRQHIETQGPIDVLVNNAGIVIRKPFLELSGEDFLAEYRVNFLGAAHCCQAVLPGMLARKQGSIVNVSSIRGLPEMAITRGTMYCITKAALVNLTSSLAKEFAPHVRINCVAPGYTKTDMSEKWNETIWGEANSSLLGRASEPTEIAEVICFLASERSSFITGQTIVCDGGYVMSGK